MRLKCMHVKNFRSIYDETLEFDNLTALVGANGVGKSSFLDSLELFQAVQPKITIDDFYNKDTENDIEIKITFTDLSDKAKTHFKKYVHNDELTVERVLKLIENKPTSTYHGFTFQNPDFMDFRKYSKASDIQREYEKLKNDGYKELPAYSSRAKAIEQLVEWESKNPKECQRMRDNEQFFGFNEVGLGYLGKYIKFLFIPAVRDASLDANEGKNSTLTELVNIVIREELMQKPKVQEFQNEFQEKYEQIFNNDNSKEILNLSESLTETLNKYVSDAKINLSWNPKNFELPLPAANLSLIEDGYQSPVGRAGHGLQRVFIMTILQHLATLKENNTIESSFDFPTLVLIIEEPELYQHPDRQRHLSKIYLDLSQDTEHKNPSKIQIVYGTHSPHFVGLDRIQQIRLLRKKTISKDKPKIAEIFSTNLEKLVAELNELHEGKYTVNNILPLLQMIRTPWINEGFFSKGVVLVEGDSDRAAILGTANALEIDLESQGISVIPCSGKGNLDKPAIIFHQLGIPIYVIWDNDKTTNGNNNKQTNGNNNKQTNGNNNKQTNGNNNSEKNANKILLKLFDKNEEDFPSDVKPNYACLDDTLETVLKNEIGCESYENMLKICMTEYDLKKTDAIKNPTVILTMLEDILKTPEGTLPSTLVKIVRNIEKLAKK